MRICLLSSVAIVRALFREHQNNFNRYYISAVNKKSAVHPATISRHCRAPLRVAMNCKPCFKVSAEKPIGRGETGPPRRPDRIPAARVATPAEYPQRRAEVSANGLSKG